MQACGTTIKSKMDSPPASGDRSPNAASHITHRPASNAKNPSYFAVITDSLVIPARSIEAIARAHGGGAVCTRAKAGGSLFTIKWPVEQDAPQHSA